MSEVEALKESFETNSKYAGWSGQAVVVGLVLDIVVLLVFSTDKSWKETAASIFATLVIGGGVWLELHFGHKGSAAAIRLQQISEERVAEAHARAAEANLKAEQEQSARVKIEERLAPRIIGLDRRNQMTEALKPFSGTEFTASVHADAEAFMLLLTLIDVFTKAGWIFRPSNSFPKLDTVYGSVGTSRITTGVVLRALPLSYEVALKAFSAFRFSGLKSVMAVGDIHTRFEGTVHIEVGQKGTIP